MAQGKLRRPPGLSDYEWRIYRRTGLTPSQARARGISLAGARGHRAVGGVPEHKLRVQRRYERGLLSEREEAFVVRQANRTEKYDEDELRDYFLDLSPERRAEIMARQQVAVRRYKASLRRKVGRRFRGHWAWGGEFGAFPPVDSIEGVLNYYH